MYFKTDELRQEYIDTGAINAKLRKRGVRYWKTTNVLWGVASAAAAATAVLGIFTRWKRSGKESERTGNQSGRVSLHPVLGPGQLGLSLTWSP
jgi:hypothetical protein